MRAADKERFIIKSGIFLFFHGYKYKTYNESVRLFVISCYFALEIRDEIIDYISVCG